MSGSPAEIDSGGESGAFASAAAPDGRALAARGARRALWVAPLVPGSLWVGALVLHGHPEALPLHVALGLLTVWTVALAARPRLSVARLWMLLALIGASATAMVSLQKEVDARWRVVRDRYAKLRVGVFHTHDEVAARALYERASRGDALALDRLVERVSQANDGLYRDHANLVRLGLLGGAHPDEPPTLDAREVFGLPPVRGPGSPFTRDAITELERAERWLVAVGPDFDEWHQGVIARLDAFMGEDGKRPAFVEGRWQPGQVDAKSWPGDAVPYERLPDLGSEATESFCDDWLARLQKSGAPPAEIALLALEGGLPERAVPALERASAAAEADGDLPELARAAFWMAVATRRPDRWQSDLREVSRYEPDGWPSLAATGVALVDPVVGGAPVAPLTPESTLEWWGKHVLARQSAVDALCLQPAGTPRERARPERALLLELAARLSGRLGEKSEMERHLGELRAIRPRLAREVEGELAGLTAAGLAQPLLWSAPRER